MKSTLTKITSLINETVSAIEKASMVAKERTLQRMIDDTDEYVPYSTGKTSKSVTKLPNNSGFKYTTTYAEFAFDPVAPSGNKKVYNTSVHSKAQGYPIEASRNANMNKWRAYYVKELVNELRSIKR